MKITITFDSLEEFKKHIIGVPEAAPAQKATEALQSDEAPQPKKNPKKAEKPQEEDAGQSDEAPEKEGEVSEEFRVEVRKTLAKLNKKVGKNMASELIKEFGVEKLTEVSLSDLPALMDKAKEALNAK